MMHECAWFVSWLSIFDSWVLLGLSLWVSEIPFFLRLNSRCVVVFSGLILVGGVARVARCCVRLC